MISIYIAEDQQLLLGALEALLNLEDDMEIVGKGKSGQEAVDYVHKHQPDVCIMDIEMPEKTGLEAAEELKALDCKLVILTTFARSGYFQRALQAGVSAYLLKDSSSDELAQAIRLVVEGKRVYAPELMDDVFRETNPLTEREKAVLSLIADGKSTKEISIELDIKIGTVRNYVSVILEKLDVKNRIEAVTHSKEKGWFS
ncbi:response regulator transcription factor [Alkalicoccobacillus murimartini]|uniref:Two-component system response regulator DesR n=1 Tax=Alkalicoccobacillus murimartini TaxID=171685 RepID=A0ABT9YLT0_9BACI|nr:response regulator transcription factor [Alkalicoccobacillus murimartini]MDQ0208808.1 two-component system response regulator DesR [Alkalicoccobacillus murimartini]